ncbi:MAG: site-2 protease family protein [Clostridia bacterium]|nr:site-2 protease family protein [Clostridia bacterium]
MSFFMDKLAILSILFTALSISVSPHPLILVICYAIHELGHLFFATLVGAKIKKFKLGAFHLCLSYDCTEISYLKEMLVCFGGIIFNVISALILLLIPIFKGEVIDFFVLCNLSLALMNLYPAAILDGGGVLHSFLYIVTSQEKADKISRGVSIISTLILWLISVYLQLVLSSNLSLLVISIVILIELCFSLKSNPS